ncbi:unnamed protein product [Rotaria socialis]|uniref:G-protein coupled receptors family 1 profile domain-containing protein n=1 Tax=Rotaria socialis TaxID=392032 RepID=A0A821QAT5_9BILA|nr:unnamed protein product [Rotaria socialis]
MSSDASAIQLWLNATTQLNRYFSIFIFIFVRTFVVFALRTVAYCLITLATIDGWLSSCVDRRRRQWSTRANAQRVAIIILIFSCFLYVQMFYSYEAYLINAPLRCYGKTISCRLVTDFSYAFVANIFPLFIMLSFRIITIINIHQSRRRTQAMNTAGISKSTAISQQ